MTDAKAEEQKSGPEREQEPEQDKASLNPMQVVSSVFAAGLGVQSSKNRERDFKQGKFSVFIIAGVVFTLVFIGVVFTVVKVVLSNAGG
jgi:Protein of unknown function (DUF2970)